MEPPSDNDAQAVLHAFLSRYFRDVEQGTVVSLQEYQALFPGRESLIESEFARCRDIRRAPKTDAHQETPLRTGSQPRSIGPYRIERELGRGGQGVVYLARDPALQRHVALKVLFALERLDAKVAQRFRREAEAASRLEHPGICPVYATGLVEGTAYIAMRYIDGQSLETYSQEIQVRDRAFVEQALILGESVARALHEAHRHKIIHRDIKPGNVMLDSDHHPFILDFGLARDEDSKEGPLTMTGDLFGTPYYMSPEQVRGQRLDPRTDVYSLGVTLYELLTGTRPFEAPTREMLFDAIVRSDPQPARSIVKEIPRDLEIVLQTAMEKSPERRYQSAMALAEDLSRVRRIEPIMARPASVWHRLRKWSKRNPALSTALIGLFVVLTVALGVTYANKRALERSLHDATVGRDAMRKREVERLIEEGFQLIFSADPRGGLERFEEALELAPKDKQALAGVFLMELEDPSRALTRLEEARDLQGDADLEWMRSMAFRVRGQEARAEEILQGIEDEDTELRAFLRGFHTVGSFYPPVDEGAAKRSVEHFRRAVMMAAQPRFHYYHSLMMAARHARDLKTMEDAGQALVTHWPKSPHAWEALVQFYFPFDRPRALRALEKVIELGGGATPHFALATHYQETGEFEKARESLQRAAELSADEAVLLSMEAIYHERVGESQQALSRYRRLVGLHARGPYIEGWIQSILRLCPKDSHLQELEALNDEHPESPGILSHYGLALFESGQPDLGIETVHRAIQLAPYLTPPYANLASMLDSTPQKALSLFTELSEAHPDNATVRRYRARWLARVGDVEEAALEALQAIRLDPHHEEGYELLTRWLHGEELTEELRPLVEDFEECSPLLRTFAAACAEAGEIDEALLHLHRALENEPESTSLIALRDLLSRHASHDRSLHEFRLVRRRHPQTADVHVQLGFLHAAFGDYGSALIAFEDALELDPGLTDARAMAVLAYADRGGFETARALLDGHPSVQGLHGALSYASTYLDILGGRLASPVTSTIAASSTLTSPTGWVLPTDFGALVRRESVPGPQPEGTLEDRRRHCESWPNDISSRLALIQASLRDGSPGQALSEIRELLDRRPRDPLARARIAALLLTEEEAHLDAYHHASAALELSPSPSAFLLSTLARSLAHHGERQQARETIEQAIQAYDRVPDPHLTKDALLEQQNAYRSTKQDRGE